MTPGPGVRGAIVGAALLTLAGACGDGAESSAPGAAPELELLFRISGLERPESVAWDSVRSRWLVTNVGGDGGDGRGFVASISRTGDSVTPRAYDSSTPGLRLDSPRGIAVRGDRAYVADGRRIVAVDLADDVTAFAIEIPGSELLEDVAVDGRGIIYASDPRADAVFRVAPDGSGWKRVPAVGSLRRPGALLVDRTGSGGPDRLLVAGREGALVALNPDSSVALLADPPGFGGLDGLQRSPAGDLVVSDRSAGRLHLFRSGPRSVWRAGVAWLGDLDEPSDFLIHGQTLVVPESGAGRVSFYRIRE